jgi:Right handed beta helix region
VRIPCRADGDISEHGILRLRKPNCFANRLASLRMTESPPPTLRTPRRVGHGIIVAICLLWSAAAWGTTYYVSSSSGNDASSGTSQSVPWQTIAHVNAQTFNPGDSILFKRGDTWNESLVPPSSGASGSPITFDAYGTGAAPNLTGYYAVPATAWVHVTGNAWKAPLPAGYTTINFCLFGSIWGQKVAAVTTNLTTQWDFYLASGFVYVYATSNPATYYNEPIVPMALSNTPVINVNGKTWLVFQHFLVNWFDDYGVYVQGASDHLVFANMEADSMIPQGTQPLGFYVNESGAGPSDLKIYNSEAHLNYDGFRIDGSATAITMVNDKAYGNRDGALVDNTGAVTYSHCHFYASSLAVAGSTDVEWTSGTGPTAGAGNITADTPPAVWVWQRYPAQVTLTLDDVGMTPGADTYYASTVLPIADAAGVPVGTAITVGYGSVINPIVSEIQGWINAGRDVTSHSVSHTYYTNTDALDIQYTGSGTGATLAISSKTLTITVTGASDSVSYNLAQGQAQGTIQGLRQALQATGKFTATESTPCQGPYGTGCSAFTEAALLAQDLADVSSQDVKSSVYAMQLDVTRLTTDEITLSRSWMTANLTGLPATPVYVYPGGYETNTMQGITAGVPYSGARGALKEDLGVKDTYSSGFDEQNVTSFGVNPSWMGLTAASLNQKVQALVWKEMVWGVPWGIFWHAGTTPELSSTEVTNLIGDLQNAGATIQSNTGLVNWLTAGMLEAGTDGNFYYKIAAGHSFPPSGGLDLRPTASSPVVNAGQNLGAAYQLDINGVNQNQYGSGWEIGAHVFVPQSAYGETNATGSPYFAVRGVPNPGAAQLPQNWVNNQEINPPHGVYDVTRTATTFGQLQQAICDWVAAPDQWWLVQVPHGTVIDTTSTGYTCTQAGSTNVQSLTMLPKIVNGGLPTKFIVFDSDTPLPSGQTVCSHGVSDPGTSDTAGTRQPPSGAISTWWTTGNNGCGDDIGAMWTLEGNYQPGNLGLLIQAATWDATTNLGPSYYAFKNVEMRPIASLTFPVNVVNTDVDPRQVNAPTMTSQMASHIHFTNVYGHGDGKDWTGTAGGPGNNHISSFFRLEGCQFCSVTYSYVDYATSSGADSHVVSLVSTAGPLKIAHNWLSGAAEAFITGGATSTNPNYFDRDLEIRGNRLTNPPTWVGSSYGGAPLDVKNRLELKACERCLVDGNILEYIDTQAQEGQCITLTPRNCSAGAVCDNYQAKLQDITLTNNICRHALTGIETDARSNYPGGNGGGTSWPLRRVSANNNLFYDLGNAPVYDKNEVVANPYVIRPVGQGSSFICAGQTVSGANKVLNCQGGMAGLEATGISAGDMFSVTNCADSTWNAPSGNYGATRGAIAQTGTDPTTLIVYYNAPAAVSASTTGCIVGNVLGGEPNFNFIHNTVVMQTTNDAENNGRIYSGGSVQLFTDTGCGGAGPSHATTITALSRDTTGTIVTASVASTSGWPSTLSVGTQRFVEVTRSGDFNGTFYYLGISGGNLQWMQTGAPNEVGVVGGTAQQMGNCPANMFGQNNVWKDNLLAVDVGTAPSCPTTPSSGWTGWATSAGSNVEGCPSGTSNANCSENVVDPTNSTVTNTDFPGRCAAKYMEVGGANAGAIPPVTLTFPASTVCSGATADPTCVGMIGMMSGAAFDENDSSYHNYGLVASSQYKAGATNAADDGTDMGATFGSIDAAQVSTQYGCESACGSGAYSDIPVWPMSGPIVINGQSGTVVQGLHITSTTGDCVEIINSTNITIQNSEIGPCAGNGIKITGGNGINVYDSYIHPETLGCCDNNDGIFATGSPQNIVIQGNVIAYGESNIEVQGGNPVTVTGNFLLNPRGPFPRGQQFQCWNNCSNVTVSNNYALSSTDTTQYLYAAGTEDSINFGHTTTFTAQNNFITGGQSVSGCGIMADTFSTGGQILSNLVLNTGECGIGLTDGSHTADSNKVYITNPVTGGGNTAVYAAHFGASSTCGPMTITNNVADEIQPGGTHSGFWTDGNCGTINTSTDTFGASADALLTPTSTVFVAPLIPPQPKHCVVGSRYSTQSSAAPCVP